MVFAMGTLVVIAGYLLGSIPTAYWIGRQKGVDMLKCANGRIGTSLAFRRLGTPYGLIVGLADSGKGAIAVTLVYVLNIPVIFALPAGLAAVIGHNWSLYLGFKGGRGTMASYGVLASLAHAEFVIALAVGSVLYFLTRKSTLATLVIFVILPILVWTDSLLQVLPVLRWENEVSPMLMVFAPVLLIPILLKRVEKC